MTNVKFSQRLFISLSLLLASEISYGRYAAIVVDANTGNVVQQVEANQAWYPASLTKVMTLYMAFSALKNGRLHMGDMMTVSSHAAHQSPSKLGLKAWERISVEDAILAVITRSANDAAVVLAEHIGGSESRFASKMTSQAHSLDMNNSNFMNATGLPQDRQVTTARDMAMLTWRIQRDFPEYYPLFATSDFYFKGRELHSTNKFVASYPGAEGMKTGYTCGAGFNLIATAQQNGKRLIGVVLGGKSSNERYNLMYELMDDNFYSSVNYGRGTKNHIANVTTYDAGRPPYQLDCGNRPSSTYAYKPAHEDNRDRDVEFVQDDSADEQKYVKKTTLPSPSYSSKPTYKPYQYSYNNHQHVEPISTKTYNTSGYTTLSSVPKPTSDNTQKNYSAYHEYHREQSGAPSTRAKFFENNQYAHASSASSKITGYSRSTANTVQEWAIDLGGFTNESAAESKNKSASIELARALGSAHPVVVKRQSLSNQTRWHALWSGYNSIYAAGDACNALWQRNIACTVSRPEGTINSSAALQ